jgi:heparan-alpha-glucosaminide N-acetyltransferase
MLLVIVNRFIFIMGTAMTFSFRSMYRREMTLRAIVWKIVFRAIKLFALGIVLATGYGRE